MARHVTYSLKMRRSHRYFAMSDTARGRRLTNVIVDIRRKRTIQSQT